MKKILVLFLLLAALCVPICSAAGTNSHVFEIYHAYENLDDMTLAEFSDACVNYLGLHSVTPAANTFSDLRDEESNILRLVALGCIEGYGDGTVHPGDKVNNTRASIILGRLSRTLENYSVSDLFTSPDITPEMNNPTYWISKIPNAYQTLLSKEEIAELNRETLRAEGTNLKDLETLPKTFDGKALSKSLSSFASPATAYIDGKAVQETYWNTVRKNIANASVRTSMDLKYGIIVNRTYIKAYPTEGFISDDPADPEWDIAANTSLCVNEPVAVYFKTKDGKFTYVACDCTTGWVPTKDIAICKDKIEWKKAWNTDNFLLVTDDRIYLEPSESDPDLSEKMLTIGTKLALVQDYKGSSLVMNRIPWNNYIVKMPVRDAYGAYTTKLASVPANRGVHVGYLPLSRANLLTLAFNCLGDHYGWGGMLDSLDCSDYTRAVYRCCGVDLPRNTTNQTATPTGVTTLADGATAEERSALLDKTAPGSILFFRGHVMLYLGKIDNQYYVISSVSRVIQDGKNLMVRSVLVNPMGQQRTNGSTWLESFSAVVDPTAGYVEPAPEPVETAVSEAVN